MNEDSTENSYVWDFDGETYYYLAGYFAFDENSRGLGAFGYSSSAGGGLPGHQGFFQTLNQGNLIGFSILEWGNSWKSLDKPCDDYSIEEGGEDGYYYEHYNLNYIGDPLLRT
jgi:hypothetical protein